MKLTKLLGPESIASDLEAEDKLSALKELVDVLVKTGKASNGDDILKVLLEREKLGSTGIGNGVAIPHSKSDVANELLVCLGRSIKGVEFESMDGKPVHLFFLLVVPEDSHGAQLAVLARASYLLGDESLRSRILDAPDAEGIYQVVAQFDGRD